MFSKLVPLLAPSIVKTVEARQGDAGRWRWYGLDWTDSVVSQCAGNWKDPYSALAAGRSVFPRARQRIKGKCNGQ